MYTYICVLWIPIPQKIANASTKFSSFFVKCRSSNLLMSWKKFRMFKINIPQNRYAANSICQKETFKMEIHM